MARKIPYTAMTLKAARKLGWVCEVTEKWNPFAKPFGKRHDLFNFIDIVCLDPKAKEVIGIQSTSRGNHSTRFKKIVNECADAAILWLLCGCRIEVHSWKKKGHRWELKRQEVGVKDF